MKKFLRFLSLVVVFSLVLACPVSASEETTITSRESAFFGIHNTYLHKTSSTSFQVWFDVVSNVVTMDELGVSKIVVQRTIDGSTWTTMKIYYPEQYPQMICENTVSHADCVTYSNATSGYHYRAKVIFYAKNSTGSSTLTRYTSAMGF